MKLLKWIGALLLLAACAVGGLVTYLLTAFPKVPALDKALKIELTADRVKRGAYLTQNVVGCISCHSQHDFGAYGYSRLRDKEFQGGFHMSDVLEDMPGDILPPNLTMLQDHTDGELYRAITQGVRKDGQPMFPMMPYLAYGKMDKEDVYSIIAFLRTLKPQGEKYPPSKLKPPFNLIFRTVPKAPAHETRPDGKDSVALGRYIVHTQAACFDCHTPWNDKHEPLAGMEGAGGGTFVLNLKGVRTALRPANITPDAETGIGAWDKKMFISVIRERGKDVVAHKPVEYGKQPNHHMPYEEFMGMSDQELGGIYDYLRTLKPVKNQVVRWELLSAKQ